MSVNITMEETTMLAALFDWYDQHENVDLFKNEYYRNLFVNLVNKTNGQILDVLPRIYCDYRKYKKKETVHSYTIINNNMNKRYALNNQQSSINNVEGGAVDYKAAANLLKRGAITAANIASPHVQKAKVAIKNEVKASQPHIKQGFIDALKEVTNKNKQNEQEQSQMTDKNDPFSLLFSQTSTQSTTPPHWSYNLTKTLTTKGATKSIDLAKSGVKTATKYFDNKKKLSNEEPIIL
jgi:hypothetical protein